MKLTITVQFHHLEIFVGRGSEERGRKRAAQGMRIVQVLRHEISVKTTGHIGR